MKNVEIVINIETGNSAFKDNPLDEIGRLVHIIADRIMHDQDNGSCFDSNGNNVGTWFLLNTDKVFIETYKLIWNGEEIDEINGTEEYAQKIRQEYSLSHGSPVSLRRCSSSRRLAQVDEDGCEIA